MGKLELKGQFIVNQQKRTVVYVQKSKGENISGKAKCQEADEMDVEFGKALAFFRYERNVRKRDLNAAIQVRDVLASVLRSYDQSGRTASRCKLWDHYHQDACEQVRMQREHLQDQDCLIWVMTHPAEVLEDTNGFINIHDRDIFETHEDYIQKLFYMLLEFRDRILAEVNPEEEAAETTSAEED